MIGNCSSNGKFAGSNLSCIDRSSSQFPLIRGTAPPLPSPPDSLDNVRCFDGVCPSAWMEMEGRGGWGCSEGRRQMVGSSRSLKIGGSGASN